MRNNFTVISNNCWGAEVYKDLNKPYSTPFVGLFIPPECYILLLEDLEKHMSGTLDFIQYSKYDFYNQFRKRNNYTYPIGILNSSIEIHFLHYNSVAEAKEKWLRRTQRLKFDSKIFIKFCDREVFDNTLFKRFDDLKFKNKVCFTSQKLHLKSAVQILECKNQKEVIDGKSLYPVSKYYFDVLKWIETGNGSLNFYKAVKLKLRIVINQIRNLLTLKN